MESGPATPEPRRIRRSSRYSGYQPVLNECRQSATRLESGVRPKPRYGGIADQPAFQNGFAEHESTASEPIHAELPARATDLDPDVRGLEFPCVGSRLG